MTKAADIRKKQKQKCFEEWMRGEHLLLHLDSRAEGVEVPGYLANNPALTLKLSYLFQGKTEHDDEGITAYLRFSGDYFKCAVPWDAVWGMTGSSGENQIWNEDLPREVVLQLARAKFSELTGKLFTRRKKGAAEDEAKGNEGQAKGPKKTPTLKRIK